MTLRVLSLGWGVQSFTLAAMVAVGDLPPVDLAIHADTRHEADGTYKFAAAWGPWLADHGVAVETVQAADTSLVHEKWGGVMIPAFTVDLTTNKPGGQVNRQCTRYWKIAPIKGAIREALTARGLKASAGVVDSLQGISLDEWTRMRTSDVQYINNVYPLVDMKMTREDCKRWLAAHDLPVPPKSSCTFCPFHKLDTWKAMKAEDGPDWAAAVAADDSIADAYLTRAKPAELYIHPRMRRLAEAVRIPEDYGAEQPSLGICDGGFCDV